MSEYKKEIASMVAVAIIGVIVIATAAIYLSPTPSINSSSSSLHTPTISSFTVSTTTNTLPCDQARPLNLVGVDFFENSSGLFMYSRWSNCASKSVSFVADGQNLLINITSNGQTRSYTGYVSTKDGNEGVAVAAGFGDLTESLLISSQADLNGGAFLISGTLVATNPSTGQAISSPQGFQVFSSVGNAQTMSTYTSVSVVSSSHTNSTG
jgi:hypothetical protein